MSTSHCLNRATDQYAANGNRGQAPFVADEEELWHAQVGNGDVRRLTLTQLDELYRADVITESTYLWQKGRKEWATLSVVLSEHPLPTEEEPFHVLMKDRSVRVIHLDVLDALYQEDVLNEDTYLWQKGMSGWKRLGELVPVEEVELELATNPMATRAPVNEAVTVRYNHQPSGRDSAAPTVRFNSMPLAVASVAPSSPPVTLSLSPEVSPVETSRQGTWLLRLALAAGLLLALGRNDAFLKVARATKQAPSYVQRERAILGGPAFGTPRAVEELVANMSGPLQPVRVPLIVPSRLAVAAPAAPNNAKTEQSVLPSKPVARPVDGSSSAGSPVPSPGLATNVTAALQGVAPPPKPATNAQRPAAPRKAAAKTGKLKGSSNYYDPLNGSL